MKGWSADFIAYWQTGLPFTVGISFLNPHGIAQINLPLVGTDRPDISTFIETKLTKPSINQWFNYTAFTPQAAGTAGDERSNQLYGPHQRRADLSLAKNFALREKESLQFRAKCYNIANAANFALPASTISGWAPGPGHGADNPISAVGLLPGDIATSAGGLCTISSPPLASTRGSFNLP